MLSRLEKRWRKVAKVCAIVVVFWTVYLLILPAITMENDTYCGLDEHIHDDGCYAVESNLICGYDLVSVTESEEPTTEEFTTEEFTTEEQTTEEQTTEESATEEITFEETVAENTETTEECHIHTSDCYEYKKTLECTVTEHMHEEVCFIEELASAIREEIAESVSEDDNGASLLADTTRSITRVNFDNLDGSGGTYYVVYTLYNNKYYAVPGVLNGTPLEITVNSDGTIVSDALNDNYYWNFTQQSGSAYYIQNLGSGRYMHSFYNSSSDYGITTSGRYTSSLETSGSGSSKTFRVKSNSNYSRITGSGTGVAFATTTTSGSAAQYYIAEVYMPPTYHVWFDGTCGGLMSLYESPDTYMAVSGDDNTITLPSEWQSPSKYSYTLNGWYDIKNHRYYEPGATVTVTKDTVFYADWVAATYDVGTVNAENMSLIAPSLDTNSFIRTDMFDYSAVFNMQAVTHTGSVSASSHSETWSVVQNGTVPYNNADSLGFIFRDWDSGGSDISYPANLIRLNNNQGTQITSGIVEYVSDVSGQNIIDLLFNPESRVIGKNYVGQANYLYQFMEKGSTNFDGEHDGYYYYDATLNAASYNQSAQRFYIYDYLERTSDSLKDSIDANGNPTAAGAYSDFLPFNSPYANNHNNKTITSYTDGEGDTDNYQYDAKATNQGSAAGNAGTNYWFGMKSEIKFYLPDDTGTVDAYQNYGNISSHGKHMTFEFSGDDDLWIFVDGELVMDIGGLHGIMNGKIDFSTGIITTSTANDVLETGTAATVEKSFLPPLEEGDHTLTIYYMERGGSQSNCAIYFNITPRYGMELVKQDSLDGAGLDGAVFGVYTDISCTEPAVLWSSETAYQNGEEGTNVFTAINGKVYFWGVSAGKVYYLKELVAPAGYPLTDDIIRISMNSLGNSICSADALRGDDGIHTEGFEVINNTADEVHQQIAISLTNQKYTTNKRNVAVTKHWSVEDESHIPESVTVYLLANSLNTGRFAVLSEENNWTYLWTDLPIYDSIGEKIVYSVYEEQAEDFFTDIEVEDEQLINAWVQTDTFYDGGTFLIVNRNTGYALTVDNSGVFKWEDKQSAESDPSAHWIVNADGMGFHVIDESGYHIILDGTDEFIPEKDGNRILYYDNFGLAARYNNTFYYISDDFSAKTGDHLELELYINMDILIHENDDGEGAVGGENPEEDTELDDEVLVTMYNVTNTYIEERRQTSFTVEKKWDDGVMNHIHDSITVRLYAGGVDTGRTLTLNNSNGWKDTFLGLLYSDENGNRISYSVVEEETPGYHPEYSTITEVPGGPITVWDSSNSLTAGNTYMFTSGNYALASNAGNGVVSEEINENSEYQQWTVVGYNGNLKLKNEGNGRYLYYRNGSFTTSDSYTNNYTNVTLPSNRLTIGNSTSRYVTLNSSSASTTTSSGSATTLTVKVKGYASGNAAYTVTVTNIKVHHILPETGGMDIRCLYIIGGLLVTVSIVFLLCLYKKRQRKEGRRLII